MESTSNAKNLLKNVHNIISKLGWSSPLIALKRSIFSDDIRCMILAKILHRSISGSSKDELAKCILDEIEKSREINSDTVLISYSSGNLSVSLANVAIEKKYKLISVLPFGTSQEKLLYLRAMGSKIVLVPDSSAESNSCHFSTELISIAQKIHKEIPNSYLIHPYEDTLAAEIYYGEMADSIISQCNGRLDIFVCGTETLGMISKLSEKIKDIFPQCKVIGIKTIKSNVAGALSDPGRPSSKLWTESEIEDLGCPYNDLHPPIVEPELIDDWITIEDKKSFCTYLELLESEGLFSGPSSASVVAGAIEAVRRYDLKDENEAKVVVILQEPFEHTKADFINTNIMIEKNYLTNSELSKKKWWWGVFIGNLHMKAPPIVGKDSVIGNVVKNIGNRNGVVMDREKIIGVITPELNMFLETYNENCFDIGQKIIGDVPGSYCTDFRVVNHFNKTLGDIWLLLKGLSFLIITGSTQITVNEKMANGEQGYNVETIVGLLTNLDILRYITKVEGHHRKQSSWDVKTNALIANDLSNERTNSMF